MTGFTTGFTSTFLMDREWTRRRFAQFLPGE